MENCEGCFLVYPFYWSLFFLKKKKLLRDEEFKFFYETLHQRAALRATLLKIFKFLP